MDIPFKTNISICFCHLDRAVLVNWLEGGSVRDPLYLILVTLSYFLLRHLYLPTLHPPAVVGHVTQIRTMKRALAF